MSDNTNPNPTPTPTQEASPPSTEDEFAALLAEASTDEPTAAPATPPTEPQGEKVVEEPTGEATPPEPAPPGVEEPKLPAELQALAAREQEAFKQQELAKQMMQEAQSSVSSLKEKLKANPLGVLKEEFGLDYETLSRHAIEDPNLKTTNELSSIKSQMQQLIEQNKKLQEEMLAQQQERQVATYEANVSQHLSTLKTSDGQPSFPLLEQYWEPAERAAQVRNVIETNYQKSGETITVAAAAEALEQMLEGQLKRFVGLEKASQILGQPSTSTPNPPATPPAPGTNAAESLGNAPAGQTIKPTNEEDVSFEDLVKMADSIYPTDE